MWCKSLEVLNPYEALKEANTPDLKPCPFCGGIPFERSYDRLIVIGCKSCGYHMAFDGLLSTKPSAVLASAPESTVKEYYHAGAHEKAAEAWNRRAGEEDKHETD